MIKVSLFQRIGRTWTLAIYLQCFHCIAVDILHTSESQWKPVIRRCQNRSRHPSSTLESFTYNLISWCGNDMINLMVLSLINMSEPLDYGVIPERGYFVDTAYSTSWICMVSPLRANFVWTNYHDTMVFSAIPIGVMLFMIKKKFLISFLNC